MDNKAEAKRLRELRYLIRQQRLDDLSNTVSRDRRDRTASNERLDRFTCKAINQEAIADQIDLEMAADALKKGKFINFEDLKKED